MSDAQQIGRRGEALAAQELTRRGWNVVARNLRTRAGEADIVATRSCDGGIRALVVEVKATAGQRELTPRVDARKAARLWAIAAQLCGGRSDVLGDSEVVAVEVAVAEIRFSARATQVRWRSLEPW